MYGALLISGLNGCDASQKMWQRTIRSLAPCEGGEVFKERGVAEERVKTAIAQLLANKNPG